MYLYIYLLNFYPLVSVRWSIIINRCGIGQSYYAVSCHNVKLHTVATHHQSICVMWQYYQWSRLFGTDHICKRCARTSFRYRGHGHACCVIYRRIWENGSCICLENKSKWENLYLSYGNKKATDQPVHSLNMVRVCPAFDYRNTNNI